METAEVVGSGLFRETGAPLYGRQDVGLCPGGPADSFSACTGNILLGNEDFAPVFEIVFVKALEFKKYCIFVLTGARRPDAHLQSGDGQKVWAVEHGVVTVADAGDRLVLGTVEYGFRTYLCLRPSDKTFSSQEIIGRVRPPFRQISSWKDTSGFIRVMRGPEYGLLINPAIFLEQPWMTTTEMSDMGIRLSPVGGPVLSAERFDIVSAPVNDGTVQLTASGPIVLLRGRQTIGGYPRIFNVIGPDLDMLGQYGPNQIIHFTEVSLEEAQRTAMRRYEELEHLRLLFPRN